MNDPDWATGIDPSQASVARVYDYLLGGAHNFSADRDIARTLEAIEPQARAIAAANRAFLVRAVRYLAAEAGVRQFLDIGSGIPTQGNVHEIVRRVDPAARVVYVDRDPVAVAHSTALLDGDPNAAVIQADLTRPADVLGHPTVRKMIDFDEPVGLLLNIESARGLRLACALASSHPRVAGLQLGLGDLFEPLQIARHEPAALHGVMLQLRLAAGEAGVFAYDAAFARFADVEGFRAEAALAKRLGYLGKSCIHPSQVAHANELFRPGDDEIAHARRVVAAADEAEARGVGAYTVDGHMVDAPFVQRARTVLATARRMGLG